MAAACLLACGSPGTGVTTPAPTALPDSARLNAEVSAQFGRSATAWNRGDLEAFMSDYAREATTSFVDGRRPRKGWDWIRQSYAPRFAPGAQRDSLSFEELEARPLAPRLALITGRFVLARGGRTTASGPFTLVMEQRTDGWKILHDHTSSDPR
jgi:uncharacterized protein (TIGR02246 family)